MCIIVAHKNSTPAGYWLEHIQKSIFLVSPMVEVAIGPYVFENYSERTCNKKGGIRLKQDKALPSAIECKRFELYFMKSFRKK